MGLGGHQHTEEYTCTLPAEEKKRALDELREDDNIREQSLAQFREWISKHPNIRKCRTGKTRLFFYCCNNNIINFFEMATPQ